jgi:acyl-CoA thioester hydrolase
MNILYLICHMLSHNETIRVRYGETDQMGYVYYGNYALYYEVGRVELLRSLGISYNDLEKEGVALPVLNFEIKYIKPARYDELLTIKTTISELPASRITFHYECFNQENILINIAKATLVFVNTENGRPIKCPIHIEELFSAHFGK